MKKSNVDWSRVFEDSPIPGLFDGMTEEDLRREAMELEAETAQKVRDRKRIMPLVKKEWDQGNPISVKCPKCNTIIKAYKKWNSLHFSCECGYIVEIVDVPKSRAT